MTAGSTDLIRAALDRARIPETRVASETLDRLYDRYTPRLLAYIRLKLGRSLRERLESRDILQATLLKSFQHLGEFRGGDGRSLLAWLARIADREIADRVDYHHRQRRDAGRESPIDDHPELATYVGSVLSGVIADERVAGLDLAIESLSDAHREVILLRAFEDLSFKAIAQRLGKSEDACRMQYARALTALTLKLAGRTDP
jgi:RNA polymerase sigma-70 factor, ECF subfamily